MAIRQSVLALYGAITEALEELNAGPEANSAEATNLRQTASDLVGLTGSAGERGWYDELLRYFDDNRIGEEHVIAPGLDDIHADLASREQRLPPTWASRAIAAAYVLDRLSDFNVGPARDFPRYLIPTLEASPAQGPGFEETGLLSPSDAENFAHRLLRSGVDNQLDYWAAMEAMAGTLSYAVATLRMTSYLRKVKREYCSVVTTTASWPTIDYDKLKNAIEPSNWDNFYHEFFCVMDVLGDNDQGWTQINESVSGECARYRLDTGLKFWKAERGDGIFINYDMDANRAYTDKLVLVDNGYIWITPLVPGQPDQGVAVRTSKQLLISGMSATAMTKMAESMGYATNSTDMFFAAISHPGPLDPFHPSQPNMPPAADTSATWPVIVPQVPPDLRDEYCADTTKFIQDRLDFAEKFGQEFACRWYDGIDLADFDYLNDQAIAEFKAASKEAFDLATDNFRPKMPKP